MVEVKPTNENDSIADTLGRAFDSATPMPTATAELILRAKLPASDVQKVEDLFVQKQESGLSPEEETLLQDYLHVDSLLTILQSKARRTLGQAVAA